MSYKTKLILGLIIACLINILVLSSLKIKVKTEEPSRLNIMCYDMNLNK